MTAVATLAPTCEARVGVLPGDYGLTPLWCSIRLGLTVWTDRTGVTHRACRHHLAGMRSRYPERSAARADLEAGTAYFSAYVSRDAMLPCAACVEGGPPHYASPKCESGGFNHCSCDRCF